MDEVAAGFVGLGKALRGVGKAGVRVRLAGRDASDVEDGVEDLCCVDVFGVGLGWSKEPGRANAGAAGVSFGTEAEAGVGS